jgi:hypothetical protein
MRMLCKGSSVVGLSALGHLLEPYCSFMRELKFWRRSWYRVFIYERSI